jgi:amino acid adenylation domain-containing protein/non-ribosomal peptide synthase protein (TIGR01720 family)
MDPGYPEDLYPLSPMQQGMLFHSLQSPESGVCFEQDIFTIHCELDVSRFTTAWDLIVSRHTVLRTTFLWEDIEEPHQIVHRRGVVDLRVDDWRGLGEADQRQRLLDYLVSERKRGFDLTILPLMRLHLFQLAENRFWFVWNYQHMILDGWSVPLVMEELVTAYVSGFLGDSNPPIQSRPYRNFIAWLQQQDLARAKGHWLQRLKGFTVPTPLTVGRRMLAGGAATGETFESMFREIPESIADALISFSRVHHITLSTLVQGAWALLLGRYSAVEEVLFGCNVSGRSPELKHVGKMVGLFINTLPVRVSVADGAELLPWLKTIQDQVIEALEFDFSPLVDIQKWSDVPGGQSLFDSIVVVENFPKPSRNFERPIEYEKWGKYTRTGYPLTLIVWPGQTMVLEIQFDCRRFDSATINRMLGHLQTVLSGMAQNPKSRIEELPMLEDSERIELLTGFNPPANPLQNSQIPMDGGATLSGLFEIQAQRQPDAVAVTCDGKSLTYGQLNAQANRLAKRLMQCGVKPDTLVGLCVERSNELIVALLAVLKAGGAYLPIDLAYPADRLAFMLEDAQAPVLITQSHLVENLPATHARILCIEELESPQLRGEDSYLLSSAGPDNLSYVIYTSGTTGKPKGSLITHRNAVRLFSNTASWYGFNDRDVWTLFHSSAFDFSVWEIWGALLYGGRLVVVPFMVTRSPESFYELLVAEGVTVLNQTPSAFRQLIQAEEAVGQQPLALRYVIFGGEALEMQSLRPWFDRHGDQKPRLVNMYGITETTVHVTYRPLSKNDLDSGSVIGVPIPDLQIYILDPKRNLVPVGVPGEMYVGGAGLARGYLHRSELTAERFIPDHLTGQSGSRLYKTGDLARFLTGRDIEYLGRIDDQVKIRGFRIELGEIESVLCQHAAIRAATVVAREDSPGTKRLVGYLVASGSAPEASALREHLKKKLPEYMVPAAFVFLDQLPLTASGKIDRKALPVPDIRPALANSYTAPRTAVEEKLAAIWSKVLRLERVGVTDNFFELGGDSILSIQVISLARRDGLKVTPKQLFANQTIAELATVTAVGLVIPLNKEVVTGDVPLTPIQQWFFEQNLEEFHHYNQSFLFEVQVPVDRAMLEASLRAVGEQHDVLRLRYVRDGNQWRQFYSKPEETVPLTWLRVTRPEEIDAIATSTQSALNLERGPIWRVAYFDLGPEQPGRLLIVVHHLAVDAVSWRPLLEDLETAYLQLQSAQAVRLPSKTASFGTWSRRICEFADSQALKSELAFWREASMKGVIAGNLIPGSLDEDDSIQNTEGKASTLKVFLTGEETLALLRDVPGAYNTQINDVLLTALARAWNQSTGSRVLFTNMEGHGRENLFEDVDLSRTVGWYTSIFPVCLHLPEGADVWQPDTALKSIKEQLRRIPRRGIGYGISRYLSKDSQLSDFAEPTLLFNYLGQFDQVVSDSKLFKFGGESTGPWHSPGQRRRYILEINCLVIDERLEISWTYNQNIQNEATIQNLAEEFLAALKQIIAHCQSANAGGRTPSDFPLAGLDQSEVDLLVAQQREIEDIYPLSPIQTLFYSANPLPSQMTFDQWHCSLRGEMAVHAFQHAWHETLRRHTILRSTVHGDGLREPVQVVHRDFHISWTVEDWRSFSQEQNVEQWSAFLKSDLAKPLLLTNVPAMRLALIRLTDTTWKFLWSVPAMFMDGWSWPVVFHDASHFYAVHAQNERVLLEPVRPYRDYIEWMANQCNVEANEFWKKYLAEFREPTMLFPDIPDSGSDGERYQDYVVPVTTATTEELQNVSRRLQITLNTLVEGTWALLLSHQSGTSDVVFGAAYSGRPSDLHGVESIVGPFVNNLPVRVVVDTEKTVSHYFRDLHAQLLELSSFQFTPLMDIQRCTEVPWRYRLFDSVIVFQNYLVEDSARNFGGRIVIEEFTGPVHTNYPVMLLVEPGVTLHLKMIHDLQIVAGTTVERWARDFAMVLERLPAILDKNVGELRGLFSGPVSSSRRSRRKLRAESSNHVPPQTEMEQSIAGVWSRMFGVEKVSIEENFFDLGGHSQLLVQMHNELRKLLKIDFPIVTLFAHSTVRSLARQLDQAEKSTNGNSEDARNRAQRQKEALRQMRNRNNDNTNK